MDWATISALATAGGTLVLGIATFASVRSANRTARAAEGSLLAGLRPLLVASRLQDPPEKISFADQHWLRVEGGHAVAEVTGEAIYMAISLRNVGNGIGVLHGWQFYPERLLGDAERPDPRRFRRLTRDMYVPAGDSGFWQGAFRDASAAEFTQARDVVTGRTLHHRPALRRLRGWAALDHPLRAAPRGRPGVAGGVGRHWNLDRPQPRS